MKLPFLLADENLHQGIIAGLRLHSFVVHFAPDCDLSGQPDDQLLTYAIRHRLLVVTGDKDFGGLLEYGPLYGRGRVVLLRYRMIAVERIVRNLCDALTGEWPNVRSNPSFLIVLTDSGYRIHRPGKIVRLAGKRIPPKL